MNRLPFPNPISTSIPPAMNSGWPPQPPPLTAQERSGVPPGSTFPPGFAPNHSQPLLPTPTGENINGLMGGGSRGWYSQNTPTSSTSGNWAGGTSTNRGNERRFERSTNGHEIGSVSSTIVTSAIADTALPKALPQAVTPSSSSNFSPTSIPSAPSPYSYQNLSHHMQYGRRATSTARRAEQNRAAQRAFRQRKIQYVKDLEERVKELEDLKRAYDEVIQENKALKAQLKGEKLEKVVDVKDEMKESDENEIKEIVGSEGGEKDEKSHENNRPGTLQKSPLMPQQRSDQLAENSATIAEEASEVSNGLNAQNMADVSMDGIAEVHHEKKKLDSDVSSIPPPLQPLLHPSSQQQGEPQPTPSISSPLSTHTPSERQEDQMLINDYFGELLTTTNSTSSTATKEELVGTPTDSEDQLSNPISNASLFLLNLLSAPSIMPHPAAPLNPAGLLDFEEISPTEYSTTSAAGNDLNNCSLGAMETENTEAMKKLCELMNVRPHRPSFPTNFAIGMWHASQS
ncbi:uncharacterized protein VTP21DRAFT_3672 [Calcarisporiella thermophila]|uniref:uncharacterized protein n=1 Tax=Calcarisporiella thermophila TaxID=911321 RepID=UPI003744A488